MGDGGIAPVELLGSLGFRMFAASSEATRASRSSLESESSKAHLALTSSSRASSREFRLPHELRDPRDFARSLLSPRC